MNAAGSQMTTTSAQNAATVKPNPSPPNEDSNVNTGKVDEALVEALCEFCKLAQHPGCPNYWRDTKDGAWKALWRERVRDAIPNLTRAGFEVVRLRTPAPSAPTSGGEDGAHYMDCEWTPEAPDACPYCSGEMCAHAHVHGEECEHGSFERHFTDARAAPVVAAAPDSLDRGTVAELAMLRQLVEETVQVAQTDEDADGFISAYHFKTGAIHRLLAAVRTRNYPPHIEQQYPQYQRRASYTPATPEELAAHIERVRHDVIPAIEEQQRRKHATDSPRTTATPERSDSKDETNPVAAAGAVGPRPVAWVTPRTAAMLSQRNRQSVTCATMGKRTRNKTVPLYTHPAPPAPAGVDALLRVKKLAATLREKASDGGVGLYTDGVVDGYNEAAARIDAALSAAGKPGEP